jgi:hypothetical protein
VAALSPGFLALEFAADARSGLRNDNFVLFASSERVAAPLSGRETAGTRRVPKNPEVKTNSWSTSTARSSSTSLAQAERATSWRTSSSSAPILI